MSQTPRISIISPLYNAEGYVGECIDSLLAQTCGDFEAIFVDDGSTDGSLAEARAHAGDDERFTFLAVEHGGQSVARNEALKHATGEYVMFLDSDDAYAPQTVETVLQRHESLQLDAYYFTARMQYDDHSLVRTNYESFMERIPCQEVLTGYQMLVHFCKTDSFRPSACMFSMKKELIDKAGLRFLPGIIHEDLLFTMMVFPLVERCIFDLEPLYIRRMRQGSTMTKARSIKNVQGLFTVTRKLQEQLSQHADEWPVSYVDAFCSRIHATWMQLARDVDTLGDAAIDAYRDTLDAAERADFDLHVYEPAHYLQEQSRMYTESTTYKAGRALMALPTWLKDHLKRAPQ